MSDNVPPVVVNQFDHEKAETALKTAAKIHASTLFCYLGKALENTMKFIVLSAFVALSYFSVPEHHHMHLPLISSISALFFLMVLVNWQTKIIFLNLKGDQATVKMLDHRIGALSVVVNLLLLTSLFLILFMV